MNAAVAQFKINQSKSKAKSISFISQRYRSSLVNKCPFVSKIRHKEFLSLSRNLWFLVLQANQIQAN